MPAGRQHEHLCRRVNGSWGACHVSSCSWALVFLLKLALPGLLNSCSAPHASLCLSTLCVHVTCCLPLAHSGTHVSLLPAVAAGREGSHALCMQLGPDDEPAYVPIRRGDVTVHDERVAHGSGPNLTDQWRKAYVIAYR